MKSVLWIEDQAIDELMELRTNVIMYGSYNLTVAKDGAEAIKNLMSKTFDIIIVDMRIPPGDDQVFCDIYKNINEPKATEIGFQLLKRIFNKNDKNHLGNLPKYAYEPFRYGVLSIDSETEIGDGFKSLGIISYTHKSGFMSADTLLNLIIEIDNLL